MIRTIFAARGGIDTIRPGRTVTRSSSRRVRSTNFRWSTRDLTGTWTRSRVTPIANAAHPIHPIGLASRSRWANAHLRVGCEGEPDWGAVIFIYWAKVDLTSRLA